jgi:UDP-N-acetylmuramoyl-L-alanyl-D-glutamate--2,6-diaminopimelate ligase
LNALGACAASNLPLHVIKKQLATMPPIKGRMQRIEGTNIIIDYSHKPDALKHALLTLREVTKGKIILVFGAGGDRDKGKRPMMGEIATSLADEVIITSDNPRSEDPMQIIEDIIAGATKKVKIEADRRAAIKMAIEISTQEDVILIAGKGHEARQIFRHTTLDFDDYKVAEELCIDFV